MFPVTPYGATERRNLQEERRRKVYKSRRLKAESLLPPEARTTLKCFKLDDMVVLKSRTGIPATTSGQGKHGLQLTKLHAIAEWLL